VLRTERLELRLTATGAEALDRARGLSARSQWIELRAARIKDPDGNTIALTELSG
jgi:hypothetical protein